MCVYMSGLRIQLMQLSQMSTNRVIAHETYIPFNKDYWNFYTVGPKKHFLQTFEYFRIYWLDC